MQVLSLYQQKSITNEKIMSVIGKVTLTFFFGIVIFAVAKLFISPYD